MTELDEVDLARHLDVPYLLRLVPAFFVDCYGRRPVAAWRTSTACCLVEADDGALAVPLPWGGIAAAAPGPPSTLELRCDMRPADPLVFGLGADASPEQPPPEWARAPLAAARRLAGVAGSDRGLTLLFHTDLPDGLAVSPSAAAAMITARALVDLHGLPVEPASLPWLLGRTRRERAELAAAASGRDAHLVATGPDGRTHQVPCDLRSAGLRLLLVELGGAAAREAAAGDDRADDDRAGDDRADDQVEGPGADGAGRPAGPLGSIAAVVDALRAGGPAALGPLLTAACERTGTASRSSAPTRAALAALNAAGALGAGVIGHRDRLGVVALVRVADVPTMRRGVRDAVGAERPVRFLTATPTRIVEPAAFAFRR